LRVLRRDSGVHKSVKAKLHIRPIFVDGVGPWLWPEADDWGFLSPARDWSALRDLVCKHTAKRRVIVQAGGCCGLYPRLWSIHFDRVYTFEPDPLNFFCLARNCSSPSIVKAEAALSDTTAEGNLISGPEHNVGMHKLGAGQGRPVRRVRVDDLKLPCVDAVQLDCEGHEAQAIDGARETICRHRPVLAIEGPNLELMKTILALGYREAGRCGVGQGGVPTDVVFAPLKKGH
jgi:FkbM family methyltransferase